MLRILQCGFVLIICFFFFFLFGHNYNFLLKRKKDVLSTIGLGFFVYYGLFQLIALPCIFLKQSLSLLTVLWGIVILIMIVLGAYQLRNIDKESIRKPLLKIEKIYFLVVLLVLIQCILAALSSYGGWDTAYYIGVINTSLYTDTMYIYDGTSGLLNGYIPLRYALSTFYMNSAVWCRFFNLEAILMQKYVVAVICQLMTNLFALLIARKLFASKKQIGYFLCIYIICNLMFVTVYSSAGFLIERGYEAKAFCANVLILAVIYGYLNLRGNVKNKRRWIDFFVIVSATIPISMSALLVIPVLVFVLIIALFYEKRNIAVLKNGLICLIPNITYLFIYLFHVMGIIVI